VVLRITDDDDPAAVGEHRVTLGHALRRVVGALGVNGGPDRRHERVGRVLVEHDDVVHRAQRREHLRALARRHHGAPRPFQPRHRRVAVDADEEHVAERAGGLEIADVADVQEVEAAVGEDEALALCP